MSKITRLFMYACILAAPACGSKTTSTPTAGVETSEAEKTAWPHAILRQEPEDSLKPCDSENLSKQYADGAERWFYRDTLMNGAYKTPYTEEGTPCYSVATYRDGIKNDTVRHYHAKEKWLRAEVVTLDSIHEIAQLYYSNGYPKIRYEATRGRLDGARMRWTIDGKPDKLQHFKDGELHGEEKTWYPNGYLASVESYADGERVISKSWHYSRSADDAYYHLGATEAPDRQFVEYALYNGYRMEESYEAAGDDVWLLTWRRLFERGKELCAFEKHGCDVVMHDTVSDGSRLEVRDYLDGRLLALEQYPLSSGGGPAVYTEAYSETGQLVEKHFYDSGPECLVPMRVYAEEGAVITGIGSSEYKELIADSCNVYLDGEARQWVQNGNSATLRCRGKEIGLLGSSGVENDSDLFREWSYDGYNARSGLHFFSFTGFEAWGCFAADDATGLVTQYKATDRPVFCGRSDLFFVENTTPYNMECAVYIYRQLPGGRLAKVATLDRGGVNFYSLDLEKLTWVGERTLVATRIEPNRRDERYYSFADEQANEGEMPYLRIEVTREALQSTEPLPLANELISEMNDQLKEPGDA